MKKKLAADKRNGTQDAKQSASRRNLRQNGGEK